jgi:hypothetical protein
MNHKIHRLKMTYVIDPDVQVWRNPAIQDIQSWTKDVLSEVLDKAFSELPNDQLHIIQSCQIDLEVKESDFYNPLWFDKLLKKIKVQLESTIQKEENHVVPHISNPWLAFVHFLNKGYWPWWYESVPSTKTPQLAIAYFESVLDNTHSLNDTNGITSTGWQRWANHLWQAVDSQILFKYVQWRVDIVRFTTLVLAKAQVKLSSLNGTLLRSIVNKNTEDEWLQKLNGYLQTKSSHTQVDILQSAMPLFKHTDWWTKVAITNIAFEKTDAIVHIHQNSESVQLEDKLHSSKGVDECIPVINAGVVLIAPFLPMLFERLHLKKDNVILNVSKCLRLMQYASSGFDAYDETDWVLFKLLLGIKSDHLIEPGEPLSDSDKAEVEQMLQAVIDNWSAIKNTSIEGLRVNFINRKGMLTMQAHQFHLRVQKETVDILLSQLPWSFQMIKWPWMKGILMTQWDY